MPKLRDRYISVPAAAALCGMSPRTFGLVLDEGYELLGKVVKIPYIQRRPGAHRRVLESDVLKYRNNITYQGCSAADDGLPDLLRGER